MVFNTGAALLDAIVLAVVSKEEEGTGIYGFVTGLLLIFVAPGMFMNFLG